MGLQDVILEIPLHKVLDLCCISYQKGGEDIVSAISHTIDSGEFFESFRHDMLLALSTYHQPDEQDDYNNSVYIQ